MLEQLRREVERREAERRYWAMVEGNEMYGVKVTWTGSGTKPKSEWDYDTSEREAHIQALGLAAGLVLPVVDQAAADRAAWQALRALRRQRRG